MQNGFNSMKVRLKPAVSMLLTLCHNCFNSMKVRLKPYGSADASHAAAFQFHEGPIKTTYKGEK